MSIFKSVDISPSQVSFDDLLLLHQAASKYDHEKLKTLLENGSSPHVRNKNGQTILHVLLCNKFRGHLKESNLTKCVEVILHRDIGELINATDASNETALSYAVSNGFESCATLLVKHGASSSINTKMFPGMHSLATCIAKTMPNVMLEILNSGIKLELEPAATEQNENVNTDDLEEKIILDWSYVLQLSDNHANQLETAFLFSLSDVPPETRFKIFHHPLISAFLHLKTSSISWKLKILQFLMLLYPGLYMIFVYYQYFVLCPYDEQVKNSTLTECAEFVTLPISEHEPAVQKEQWCKISWGHSTAAYLLILVIFGFGLFELYMLFRGNWIYLRSWRSVLITLALFFMGFPLWPALQPTKNCYDVAWVYPTAALATLLAWLMILIQMQLLFPAIKTYLEIFASITTSVLKVTLLFLPLLVGFFMGFNLMFLEKSAFHGVMTFILMTVDVGTSEFVERIAIVKDKNISDWYGFIASCFSTAFLLIINIIFMNFLLGVSIEDIQKLKRKAKVTTESNVITNLFIIDLLVPMANKVCAKDKDTGKIQTSVYYYPNKHVDNDNTVELPENITTKITFFLKSKTFGEPMNDQSNSEMCDGDTSINTNEM